MRALGIAGTLSACVISACVFYQYDESIDFVPVYGPDANHSPPRFHFFLGQVVANRLGNPPFQDAEAIAAAELQKKGFCRDGVNVLPRTFARSGTFGLEFEVECR